MEICIAHLFLVEEAVPCIRRWKKSPNQEMVGKGKVLNKRRGMCSAELGGEGHAAQPQPFRKFKRPKTVSRKY
jgi:hypothetical protein